MKKILQIIIPVFICLLGSFIISRLQLDSIANWYPTLDKSSLTPPAIVFPIVWGVLYVFMGISIGVVLNTNASVSKKRFLVGLFSLQLFLNFAWCILFFCYQNPLFGLIDILLLEVVILFYAVKSYSVSKISSWLFIPYIIWIMLATYLNFYILLHN